MTSDRVIRQIERLLDETETTIAAHDWQAAREAAQFVLGLDAQNPDALAYLAAIDRALMTEQSGNLAIGQQDAVVAAREPPGERGAGRPPQPTFVADGRYVVNRLLGEGGNK